MSRADDVKRAADFLDSDEWDAGLHYAAALRTIADLIAEVRAETFKACADACKVVAGGASWQSPNGQSAADACERHIRALAKESAT